MTDFVRLKLSAGFGGNGKVSFRREKYVPKGGPDGGKGGDGGSVIIRADSSLATLRKFAGKAKYEALRGMNGGARNKIGGKGEDLVITVPVGTEVRVEKENQFATKRRREVGFDYLLQRKNFKLSTYDKGWEDQKGFKPEDQLQRDQLLYDDRVVEVNDEVIAARLMEDGQEFVICQGGFGGWGNEHFKSSTRTTPQLAELGSVGEIRHVALELKLLADVGLVGLPNAGKSTLLSRITKAKPKVAEYPFTTIEPHLGIMSVGEKELVFADIPGLIQGASEGRGLGHEFLRHIENCSRLVYLLYLEDHDAVTDELSGIQKAKKLTDQFEILQTELKSYKPELLDKPFEIVVNKSDLLSDDVVKEVKRFFENKVTFISAITGEGLAEFNNLFR